MASTSTPIKDINDVSDETNIGITATIKTRSQLKSWSRNKSTGYMITGILSDATSSIDFVCWTEAAKKFDDLLVPSKTFKIDNIKIVMARESYSKTNHKYQVVFDKNTLFEEIECQPLLPALPITSICDLKLKEDHDKVNVVAKVMKIPSPETLGSSDSKIVKVKIGDNSGSIQLSLIGDAIDKCNFCVNDILLMENITFRVFGQLRCLQGNTGIRTVNPTDKNYTIHMPDSQKETVDLSPDKGIATEKTIDTLDRKEARQRFVSSVQATNITTSLYDKCPKVTCRTKVVKLDNGLYKCNKCEVDYFVASFGIRLILGVGKTKGKDISIIFFNNIAERLINQTSSVLADKTEEQLKEEENGLLQHIYEFVVVPGKVDGEFLCESFKVVQQVESYKVVKQVCAEDKVPLVITDSSQSIDNVNIIRCGPARPQFDYSKPSTSKATSSSFTYTMMSQKSEEVLQPDEPLNLSKGAEDITQSINFDVSIPEIVTDIIDDNNNEPLDLSQKTPQPPNKKFRFSRRLFPDMPE